MTFYTRIQQWWTHNKNTVYGWASIIGAILAALSFWLFWPNSSTDTRAKCVREQTAGEVVKLVSNRPPDRQVEVFKTYFKG